MRVTARERRYNPPAFRQGNAGSILAKGIQQILHRGFHAWRDQRTVGILDNHLVIPRIVLANQHGFQRAGLQMRQRMMYPT
jgi:hypothetical protein